MFAQFRGPVLIDPNGQSKKAHQVGQLGIRSQGPNTIFQIGRRDRFRTQFNPGYLRDRLKQAPPRGPGTPPRGVGGWGAFLELAPRHNTAVVAFVILQGVIGQARAAPEIRFAVRHVRGVPETWCRLDESWRKSSQLRGNGGGRGISYAPKTASTAKSKTAFAMGPVGVLG